MVGENTTTDVNRIIKQPPATLGLRHVALFVVDLDACVHFYTSLLGMTIEWQPDADNVYLSSVGLDNLALHRWQGERQVSMQTLDHIGFILPSEDSVDEWHTFLLAHHVPVRKAPITHRDGARSFYVNDPAGTLVQMIYHPPIVDMAERLSARDAVEMDGANDSSLL